MKVSDRIRRWREYRNLTKSELARGCEVSSAAVAQWENGDTEPTHASVEKIVKAFDVSLSAFWGEPPSSRKRKAS